MNDEIVKSSDAFHPAIRYDGYIDPVKRNGSFRKD
jgi:hypothetical protein